MKKFNEILAESSEKYTNHELIEIFNDVLDLAIKYKSSNNGAADYYHMSVNDRKGYFNKILMPLLIKLKRPKWGSYSKEYFKFQNDVVKIWRKVS